MIGMSRDVLHVNAISEMMPSHKETTSFGGRWYNASFYASIMRARLIPIF